MVKRKYEYVYLSDNDGKFTDRHGKMFKVLKKMRQATMLMSSKTKYKFVLSESDPHLEIKSYGDYRTILNLERSENWIPE